MQTATGYPVLRRLNADTNYGKPAQAEREDV